MGKSLYIAEKPSVAQEFAKALRVNGVRKDGYLESEDSVVTWCVGHLVTMSYPEVYDEKYKRWSLATLPFIPEKFLYEVIPSVKKQFQIVSGLLKRKDIDVIYVCTDSGREGEYIYRLVEEMARVKGKVRKRVWIDSQTEEEILHGIQTARDLSEYDNLANSAYLRAKEDYLMGINFSRLLSLKYGNAISSYLGTRYTVISVGRVMTCVLGMVVRREWEIRSFVKTPFYRVVASQSIGEAKEFPGEFRAVEGSDWYQSPKLYKENGFKEEKDARELIRTLEKNQPLLAVLERMEKKKETKNPPLLYNLAELQNECSRYLKISPDETLKIVQELYEKKLVTYPRTDARVLSTAVSKEIYKNIRGLAALDYAGDFVQEVLAGEAFQKIASTRYVNDKQITDHYAIIPTGQGLNALRSVSGHGAKIYEMIVRRFLSIFYPPAVYQKVSLVSMIGKERFFSNFRILQEPGYLKVAGMPKEKKATEGDGENLDADPALLNALSTLKKGSILPVKSLTIKEGETSPPKRYNSGSMILAMENAGSLIEDEELRSQIKGSGIGTSATRAEILKKLVANKYLALNKKTQVLTPTQLGEMIFCVVNVSIRSLLNPELTASWEKGLTYVAEGTISQEEYMVKLTSFIRRHTDQVMAGSYQTALKGMFDRLSPYYQKTAKPASKRAAAKKEAQKA
ncbi:type IA DNA topoisomerase [Blautia sp. OF03-15BH]|uniref:DNA topoisomerase n=1 Tax=Blautia sp. OF03-15BH TaxID=2292287 RepID=UPI000E47DC08|nr:DNA topoisomerase [Blautia sp. OF03-15BH]RGY01692.1 type IA DNA topoisomerase [Blautia sp. OF03-15BH]